MTETFTDSAVQEQAQEEVEPLLRISDLVVDYRARHRSWAPAVEGASVHVNPGEIVTLVGESGSGKTTLIHGALGLLPPTARIRSGSIAYSGIDVTRWSDQRLARVRGNYVGFIPQDPNTSLNPVKKIGHQVAEAVRFNEDEPGDREGHRQAALESLRAAGLADAERVFEQYPHELSGGMKQRALIAIALAGKPRIIVADEPTSALDVTVQRVILDHLEGLRERLGLGILLVTHDLGVALDRSDRILVMQQGRILEEGPVRDLLEEPRSDYTRSLLDAAPGRHERRLAPTLPPGVSAERTTADVIQARSITKAYTVRSGRTIRTFRALAGVDLTVRRGTTHAIVGESGAGKSTLAGILAGFTAADGGTVRVGDHELGGIRHAQLRELRRELQFVFQNPFTSLDPRFTVARIVAEPLRAFRLAGTKEELLARVREVLHAVALDDGYLNRRPAQLSGGQRQRVAIARALALRPEILVLDEAVSALDVSVQAQILQLLVDLQAELGLSYVFVTHDLGVVRLIADDVTVMREGLVIESGSAEQVLNDPQHEYTRTLLDAVPGHRLVPAGAPR